MKCPKCGTTEEIKFFLRHQAEDENDTSDNANVITILCTKCGHNQSFFLKDCLEDIFPSWKEKTDFDIGAMANMFQGMSGGFSGNDFDFDDMVEEFVNKED